MVAIRFTKDERDHALHALNAFAAGPRWKSARAAATASYFQGLPEDATAREREIAEQQPNMCACHEAYGLADFLGAGESSIAGAFLASNRALLLRRGGRAWLEEFVYSTVSAYLVRDVVPGSHLFLRDLLTDDVREVHDRLGSQDCKRGSVIAARVMARGDGKLGFHGDTLQLPGGPEELEEILREAFHEELALPQTEAAYFAFGKMLPPFLFEYWFEGNFRAEAATEPLRVNGELAEPGLALFRMPPGANAARAFAEIAGAEPDGDDSWTYRPSRGDKRVLLGRFVARGGFLRIESLGRGSMKQMRAVAQTAFGGLLRHHSTRYHPPLRARSGGSAEFDVDQVPLDLDAIGVPPEHPDFQERARAAYLAKHYGTWAQHPLPALEGRTPAQAAADPAWRARVLELIEDAERLERDGAARRGPGARAFDFGAIRAELGFANRQAEAIRQQTASDPGTLF